jgi:hypothetical protein
MDYLSKAEVYLLVFIEFLPTILVCTPVIAILLKKMGIRKRFLFCILAIQILFVFILGLTAQTRYPQLSYIMPFILISTDALMGEIITVLTIVVVLVIIRTHSETTKPS